MRSNTGSPVPGGPSEADDRTISDRYASGASAAGAPPSWWQSDQVSAPAHQEELSAGRRKPYHRARRRGEGGSGQSVRADRSAPEAGTESGGQASTWPRDPVAQARAICLRLLTGAPRTRKQLADALRKKEIPESAAEKVLSRFEEVGLIDDAAFAGAWVESRHAGRGLARRALARELRTRGIPDEVVNDAVGRIDPAQEARMAREMVDRKLPSTRGLDRQVRVRRLAGMLARRGYSEGLALRVVREALTAEEQVDRGLPDH